MREARLLRGGTEGNERLTASTGVVLLVLLAVVAAAKTVNAMSMRISSIGGPLRTATDAPTNNPRMPLRRAAPDLRALRFQ
ncbi:MAG: hypothetical protein H0W90_04170 [Actinobacteria bacterium]|nr:hypothetical protein [Actinomycetota bacterium]